VDYRKFLNQQQQLVLPYVGGDAVDAKDRRLRLQKQPDAPGWYRFTVKGRIATADGPADPPDLSELPAVRGHWLDGRLVRDGGVAELVLLPPADEPAMFAPLKGRRWPSGDLLFDALEFETDAETAVRGAYADGKPLAGLKGVPATLRTAFAFSLLNKASKELNLRFVPPEVRAHVVEVAERGAGEAAVVLRRLEAEREQARREMAELAERQAAERARLEAQQAREAELERRAQRIREQKATVTEWATHALEAAGARVETARIINGDQVEVVYRFGGERFISVADALSLQVIDSGICLGHPPSDKLITLESLPGVIQEAIDDGVLVILRWP
jgi:hypothetical protein